MTNKKPVSAIDLVSGELDSDLTPSSFGSPGRGFTHTARALTSKVLIQTSTTPLMPSEFSVARYHPGLHNRRRIATARRFRKNLKTPLENLA